jgi:hypothetical protein
LLLTFDDLIGERWIDSCIGSEVKPERLLDDPEALPCFHYRVIIHNFRFSKDGVIPAHPVERSSAELDQAHILRNETACVILANPVMRRTELVGHLRSWAQPRLTTPIEEGDCDPIRIVTAAEEQLEQPSGACTVCRRECVSVQSLRAEFRLVAIRRP